MTPDAQKRRARGVGAALLVALAMGCSVRAEAIRLQPPAGSDLPVWQGEPYELAVRSLGAPADDGDGVVRWTCGPYSSRARVADDVLVDVEVHKLGPSEWDRWPQTCG